ncbi:tandem-95 repeat protein [Pedobacter sp. BS3]|uniref:Ig-like domain-containing protein n=1 Tax=Pedobacter sp. BS3 TaxID=2567937 RepID=UPI0011ED0727|nr:Ig-like domain-containing protein [Pedobacter sp. BS3]TZF84988.1 tandem-95 repeat protein [Pedobacter sp. BS3]
MMKKLLSLIAFLISASVYDTYAQFPYFESFKNSTASGIVYGGAPAAFLTAGTPTNEGEGNGYLRLTNNDQNQKGYIYSTTNFPSEYGMRVEFEYFTYGGTGADGITFFLFDAGVSTFSIGGFGGSLGYANYAAAETSPGLSGAYLGIGLDEYGNFSNPIEGRHGGPGFLPRSVTLRGDAANGYQFLTTAQTDPLGFTLETYGPDRKPLITDMGYRRAIIELKPATVGFDITVKILVGNGTPTGQTYTLIDNYPYHVAAPTQLHYGLASSTGSLTNFHEIRNVRINPFDEAVAYPTAVDDSYAVVQNTPLTLNILDNDNGGLNNTIVPAKTKVITGPAHGTFDPVTGVYTPVTGYSGKDQFTYTIENNKGLVSNPATVSIVIKPVGVNDNANTKVNTPVVIPVKNNDPGATGTTITLKTAPPHGIATLQPDGTFKYTPDPNYSGNDTFTYTLVAPDGTESDPITVTIVIQSPPQAVNDSKTTLVNTPVVIDVTANDTDTDGTPDKTTVTVVTQPAHGTAAVNPVTGEVTYTPVNGYSGPDSFTYTVKDNDGNVSNVATVNITVKPTGTNDNATTLINTPVVIPVKNNDAGATGTTVTLKTPPAHGTAVPQPDGTVKYTPDPNYSGNDTFTYTLVAPGGTESDPITVTVAVSGPPQAVNDSKTTLVNTPVVIDVTANDTDPDGTINKTTVTVVAQPAHGAVTVNPANGQVTYTPANNYFGPDSFTYTVKDNDGNISNVATVNISIRRAMIGLAKELVSATKGINNSYNVVYLFTVRNYGDDDLTNISITDDLSATFAGNVFTVTSISSPGSLLVNNLYNGSSNTELLQSGNTLATGTQQQIQLSVNVQLTAGSGVFKNSAYAEGTTPVNGTKVNDQSTNGLKPDPDTAGDVSPAEPTPVTLVGTNLFIPQGFSPNRDGVNDKFVIWNLGGNKASVEIYNRWGNRIYRSADYDNSWEGKCTEGIYVGDDAPDGTYYYIIIINGKDKYTGYLTIKR